jgi:hypothetical protein
MTSMAAASTAMGMGPIISLMAMNTEGGWTTLEFPVWGSCCFLIWRKVKTILRQPTFRIGR